MVLREVGRLAGYLGDAEKSIAAFQRLLSFAPAAVPPSRRAAAHLGLAGRYGDLGETEKALEHLREALTVFRSLANRRGEAAVLNDMALARDELGESTEALRLFEQVLALARSIDYRELERGIVHNIASVYERRGERQKALDYYTKALELKRAGGDPRDVALTLNQVGSVYAQWGDYRSALDRHREALDLVRQIGNPQQEASTLGLIGWDYFYEGEVGKALAQMEASLALCRQIKDRSLEAGALSSLGDLHARLGDAQKGLDDLRAALATQRTLGVRSLPIRTLVRLGRVYYRQGDYSLARDALTEAREISQSTGSTNLEAVALRDLARVSLKVGDAETALAQAESAVATVESHRATISREDLRTSFFASAHNYYEPYIGALMALDVKDPQRGYAARALQVSERARARRALEVLAESAVDVRAGADQALLERERALGQELNALASQHADLAQRRAAATRREGIEKKLRDVSAEREGILATLREKSPRYAALVQPPILDGSEIQRELVEPGTALLEFALGEERSYAWLVTQTAITTLELPGGERIEALANRVYQGLTVRAGEFPSASAREARAAQADRESQQAAAELSRLILPGVLGTLSEKRLVVVADGALQVVPFAVLPLPASATSNKPRLLASRFEVVYAPSASWVATLRRQREGVPAPAKTLAVLADPVFDVSDNRVQGGRAPAPSSDQPLRRAIEEAEASTRTAGGVLPRLPFSRREAMAVASLVPAQEALVALDFDASRERAMSAALADYRIVHFATHSLLNHEHPHLSGVVLSLVNERGQTQNGFLRLQDIYNLRLPAEMVVLSACQTAMGKALAGEGLLGLARGFMYAGSRRVVASLWPVDEVATAELMNQFYRALLKEHRPPADALRKAQLAIASTPRWRAPYYWAGFVIQGDWR